MYSRERRISFFVLLLIMGNQLAYAQDMLAPGLPMRGANYDALTPPSSEIICSHIKVPRTCEAIIHLGGKIEPALLDGFNRAMAHVVELKPSHGWKVQLNNSEGGNVDTALALGRLLRKLEATVYTPPEAKCESSCVFVLIGAVHRIIRGRVGIHRPYFDTPMQAVTREALALSYRQNMQRLRQYFQEMNVSEALADRILAIAPEQVEYLTRASLEQLGILEFDPVWKEAVDAQEAQKYGLNRTDYARRRMHAQQICEDRDCYDRVMKLGQ